MLYSNAVHTLSDELVLGHKIHGFMLKGERSDVFVRVEPSHLEKLSAGIHSELTCTLDHTRPQIVASASVPQPHNVDGATSCPDIFLLLTTAKQDCHCGIFTTPKSQQNLVWMRVEDVDQSSKNHIITILIKAKPGDVFRLHYANEKTSSGTFYIVHADLAHNITVERIDQHLLSYYYSLSGQQPPFNINSTGGSLYVVDEEWNELRVLKYE